MSDEEQRAWDEDWIGTPPSRDPARSIARALVYIVGLAVTAAIIGFLFTL